MSYASHKLCQLPVLNQGGRWLMRFRGKRIEFVDRQSAVREAILEAFEHSKNGTPTQVVCIDDQLAIEIVWTYGVDPDPPAALADTSRWSDPKQSGGAAEPHAPRPAGVPAHRAASEADRRFERSPHLRRRAPYRGISPSRA